LLTKQGFLSLFQLTKGVIITKMNRQKKALVIVGFIVGALSACSPTADTKAYALEMPYHDNFKILWLSDIHWGWQEDNPDYAVEAKRLKAMFEQAKEEENPDLMVLTGDSFRQATKENVNELLGLIDNCQIPWAFTFGNHDNETFLNEPNFISREIKKCKYAKYLDVEGDELTGEGNYYLNLKENNDTLYRLYFIDSNTYKDANENPGSETGGYDVIHADQLTHLRNICQYEGSKPPSLVFFHIPLWEYVDAYAGYMSKTYSGQGYNGESVSRPYENNGTYKVLKDINVKAVFCGHDHKNYSDIFYKNETILSYALKATDLDYHSENTFGYKVITLPKTQKELTYQNFKTVFFPY
jgi:predicted MPP superfamily phosphohydrolase